MLTHLPKKIAKASEKELKMYHITQQEKDMCTLTGREEGREAEKRATALKMLAGGFMPSVIAQLIERDEKWVIALKKSNNLV